MDKASRLRVSQIRDIGLHNISRQLTQISHNQLCSFHMFLDKFHHNTRFIARQEHIFVKACPVVFFEIYICIN